MYSCGQVVFHIQLQKQTPTSSPTWKASRKGLPSTTAAAAAAAAAFLLFLAGGSAAAAATFFLLFFAMGGGRGLRAEVPRWPYMPQE